MITFVACVLTSIITALIVGAVLRKGGAAADDPPAPTPTPFPPIDKDLLP